jgi:hypothetical protein
LEDMDVSIRVVFTGYCIICSCYFSYCY